MADIFSLVGRVSVDYAQAETALDKISDAAEETADDLEDLGDSAEGAGGTTEKSGNRMSSAFKKIGSAVVAAFAVDKIVDFGKTIVDASATVAAEQSAFEQIMGDYSDNAQAKINEIADATDLAQDGLTLAADAAAFWDKSLDDSMGALNSFINGSYEGGEAIGLFANDTQLASYAVKQGIVSETKEWANLDEARKQATRLQYAQDMMQMSGATGQAAKESDQYANVQENLTEKWRQFKAQIGEPLLQNVVIPAMGKLSDVVDKASAAFEKGKKWISDHKNELEIAKGVVIGVTSAVGSFLLVMNWGSIMSAAKKALTGVKTAILAVNTAMSANPIGLVIAAITGLVAAFVYLWNTSEEFRIFWVGVWETIKSVASDVWDAIKSAADTVLNALKTGWEAFSGFFAGLWDGILSVVSTVWETIKNVVSLGLQTIGLIISAAVQIITLPFQFIWENCKGIIMAAWEVIKNIVTTAVNTVKDIITTVFNAVKGFIQVVMDGIKAIISTVWNTIKTVVTTVVNAIKSVVTTVWNAISSVTSTVFNAVKGVVTTAWNGIKSVITNVVTSVKSTVSTVWNSIKSTTSSVFNGIKSSASSVWNSIKSAIETPINAAKNAVKSAIDKMRSFFNFSWSLPKLKLPHISISGGFSLKPPSVPKFGIEWYKNGGIMEDPTMFGINPMTGKAMVGGEAGAEAIAPIDVLLEYVRLAVKEENAMLGYKFDQLIALISRYMPEIIKHMVKDIYLDTGELVGAIGDKIDRELGDIAMLKARGM